MLCCCESCIATVTPECLTLCFPIISDSEPESSSLNIQIHGDWRAALHIMTGNEIIEIDQ